MTLPRSGELVHGGTAASADRTSAHLVGRERELRVIHTWLRDPHGPALVLVHTERGAGRSALLHAVAERMQAEDVPVLTLACTAGDEERPLLLALRLLSALREHRFTSAGLHAADRHPVHVLSAVEERAQTAMTDALHDALVQSPPVVVMIDDVQHADAASLTVLGDIDVEQCARQVRLVVTTVRHTTAGDPPATDDGHPVTGLVRAAKAEVVLERLALQEVVTMLTLRLHAAPDAQLAQRVHDLTRGIPAAVDALLSEWVRQGAIRVVDGHAFLIPRAPVPVLPDNDRFIVALRALGERCGTVAAALSILWPLGRAATALMAESTGLSAEEVRVGVRDLVNAGIVYELPGADGSRLRGWTFHLPLVAHAVRERLGPLQRGRLSAAVVEALWGAEDSGADVGQPVTAVVEEADEESYLPDRICDAGALVDRKRAAAHLTAAAERVHPDPADKGMLRWLRAAVRLTEEPAARELALLRYAKAAYVTGDYAIARAAAETILRDPDESLTPAMLQQVSVLMVAATTGQRDWPQVSRLASAPWWQEVRLPPLALVSGQSNALCSTGRWQEAMSLLERTESLWNADPLTRALPEWFRACCEWMLGRPERFRHALITPLAPELPPEVVYSLSLSQVDQLLGAQDLRAAADLLTARGLPPQILPPRTRFLWLHLRGQWDEALAQARAMLGTNQAFSSAPIHHLIPSRTAAILLSRGRTTSAGRLIDSSRDRRDGQLELFLDHAEAEVLRILGEDDSSEQALLRGLRAAQAHGQVYGTDELWASLADLRAEAGEIDGAATCVERLGHIAEQTGSDRTHLLHLLTSARVALADRTDTPQGLLREAVALARSRNQPYEIAVTLSAAARADAGARTQLHEAYELFDETGATLWRFHTRTAMREAGLTVRGRKQVTGENDRLLATLIAEGLSNRQAATVLRLNEDAVANRLTRLLARTGLRSRMEVAAAVLTGVPLTETDR
ncbi:AAA family ATPase [Streptomyces sp. NPDC060006]|uniref:AAA family ATPase n=1 Tax=unclassified Streptomyces TaxID=2593676 RepID=UPI00369D1F0E